MKNLYKDTDRQELAKAYIKEQSRDLDMETIGYAIKYKLIIT